MEMFRHLGTEVPMLKSNPAHVSDGVGRGFVIAMAKALRAKLLRTKITPATLFSCMFDETNNVAKESVCSVYLKYLDNETHIPKTVFFGLDKVQTRKTGISVAGNSQIVLINYNN